MEGICLWVALPLLSQDGSLKGLKAPKRRFPHRHLCPGSFTADEKGEIIVSFRTRFSPQVVSRSGGRTGFGIKSPAEKGKGKPHRLDAQPAGFVPANKYVCRKIQQHSSGASGREEKHATPIGWKKLAASGLSQTHNVFDVL